MNPPLAQEDLQQAYQVGFGVEGPRATLAALIDVLAATQPDEHVFRNAIYQRIAPNLPVVPDEFPPEFGKKILDGALAAGAELLKLRVEVVIDGPVANDT